MIPISIKWVLRRLDSSMNISCSAEYSPTAVIKMLRNISFRSAADLWKKFVAHQKLDKLQWISPLLPRYSTNTLPSKSPFQKPTHLNTNLPSVRPKTQYNEFNRLATIHTSISVASNSFLLPLGPTKRLLTHPHFLYIVKTFPTVYRLICKRLLIFLFEYPSRCRNTILQRRSSLRLFGIFLAFVSE